MPETKARCENCGEIHTFDVDSDDSVMRPCPNCGEEVTLSWDEPEEDEGYE